MTRKAPAPRLPTPPAHLSGSSKALWRDVVDRFELQPEHLRLLTLGLEAIDRTDEARRILAKDGLMIVGARGAPMRHPLVDVEMQSRTAALRYFRELGLTQYLEPAEARRNLKGKYT